MPVILALAAAAFLSTIVMRMTDPIMPLIGGDLGIESSTVALLASAYAVPYGVFQLVWGPLGDRHGKLKVARIAVIGLGLTIVATALAPGFGPMLAARFLSGMIGGAIIPLGLATIGDCIAIDKRQAFLSRFMVAVILGSITGGVLTGILADHLPWRMVLAGYGAATLAVGVGLALLRLADSPNPAFSLNPTALGARYVEIGSRPASRRLLAVVFVEGLLVFGIVPFISPYLHEIRGASFTEIGVVIACFGLGGIVFSLAVNRLLGWLGPSGGLRFGGLMLGLMPVLFLFEMPLPGYGLVWLATGFGFYYFHNTLQLRATEMAPEARGSAFSLFAFAFFVGQGIGPTLAGALVGSLGYAGTIALAGVGLAGLGLVATRVIRVGGTSG